MVRQHYFLGSGDSTYKIISYDKSDNVIETKLLGPSRVYHYELTLDKDELVNDITYDTTKLVIYKLDNNDMRLSYDSTPVSISTTGPIRVSGPSIQTLHGEHLPYIFIHKIKKVKVY